MILTVDIGNTHQHFQLHNSSPDSGKNIALKGPLDSLQEKLQDLNIDLEKFHTIVSSVSDSHLNQIPTSYLRVKNLLRDHLFIDMPVAYTDTIGEDRLICAYNCFKTQELPCLLIDTGSFTTIDYISVKGFQGGYILPGIDGLKSLYQQGVNLCEITSNMEINLAQNNFPRTTLGAISQGLRRCFYDPIHRIIDQSKISSIILTGGNASYIQDYIHNHITTTSQIKLRPDFIHHALYHVCSIVTKEVSQ